MDEASRNSRDLPWWMSRSQLTDAFFSAIRPFAPNALSQPILPGWIFGNMISVTEQNSSAPDTEREVVASESYGRQLGRIMDALCVLISERPHAAPPAKALDDLMELHQRIEQIKFKAAIRRVQSIQSDLAMLKIEAPAEYQRLTAELKQVLGIEH
jgi:hypothetical protein